MKKYIFILLFSITLPCCACYAGLDTLIEIAGSQAQMQRQYKEETETFKRVKAAIESGAISKGMKSDQVMRKYGEPVVAVTNLDGKRKDWIYKPAESSFFEGIRATLIFTDDGILDEVRLEKK